MRKPVCESRRSLHARPPRLHSVTTPRCTARHNPGVVPSLIGEQTGAPSATAAAKQPRSRAAGMIGDIPSLRNIFAVASTPSRKRRCVSRQARYDRLSLPPDPNTRSASIECRNVSEIDRTRERTIERAENAARSRPTFARAAGRRSARRLSANPAPARRRCRA